MSLIRQSSIDALREKVDLCDLVSSYVTLRRAGSYWKGLSPFADEKTASFFVHPEKRIFKCFSTGNGGDAFHFLELKENMSFREAAEFLAEKYHFPLEYESDGAVEKTPGISKVALYELHERVAKIFSEYFFSAAAGAHHGRKYWLEERHFTLDAAERYGIGCAPMDKFFLRKSLGNAYSEELLTTSGIFIRSQSGDLFPRFQGRLMIPIHNAQSRIVAFTGRVIPNLTAGSMIGVRYINSPESPTFHKGSTLFGLHRAHANIVDNEPFIMVEGQLDCLRCWENGILTAVAPQGTGITETQLQLLRRHSTGLLMVLDGDDAGQNAARRAIPLAFKVGLDVRFVKLPAETDPDEMLKNSGPEAFKYLLRRSLSPIAMLSEYALPPNSPLTPMQKKEGFETIFAIITSLQSRAAELQCLQELSQLACAEYFTVRADYEAFCGRNHRENVTKLATENGDGNGISSEKINSAAEILLAIFLQISPLQKPISQILDPQWMNGKIREERLLNWLAGEIQSGIPIPEAIETAAEDDRLYLYRLLVFPLEIEEVEKNAQDNLRTIHQHFLKREIAAIVQKIAACGNDFEKIRPLLEQKIRFSEEAKHPPILTADAKTV